MRSELDKKLVERLRHDVGIINQTAKFFETIGSDDEVISGLRGVAMDIQNVLDGIETAKAMDAKKAAMDEVNDELKSDLDKVRIRFASSDTVMLYEKQVDAVLAALGYPRAMVTDLSKVSDFFLPVSAGMSDLEAAHFESENRKMVSKACETLGVNVYSTDKIVFVAKRLHDKLYPVKD